MNRELLITKIYFHHSNKDIYKNACLPQYACFAHFPGEQQPFAAGIEGRVLHNGYVAPEAKSGITTLYINCKCLYFTVDGQNVLQPWN